MKLFDPDNSTYQPVYFFPDQGLAFTRCQLLPGVTLQRLEGPLKRVIASAKDMPGEKGGYNFAVVVQHGQYAEHVNQELKAKGHEPLDDLMVETSSITKHVVLSLVLVARTRFRIGGELQMKTEQKKDKTKKSRLASYGPGLLQFQESSGAMFSALGQSERDSISRRHLVPIVNSLELYFRSGMWTNDRLAMALSSFWNAVCTPFQDQAFLGLTTSLEAILSTQPMEITHTLAERAAALIGKDTDDRIQVYRLTKSLYKTRSKIVHGAAFPKRGVQHVDRLFITAKHANVPVSELKDLVNLTITVINGALLNDDYSLNKRRPRCFEGYVRARTLSGAAVRRERIRMGGGHGVRSFGVRRCQEITYRK